MPGTVPDPQVSQLRSWLACVLLNFMYYGDVWTLHFIKGDCRTTIGQTMRYCSPSDLDALRSFVRRCQTEDGTLAAFERCVRAWGQGSEYVYLTPEQYES